MIGPNGLLSTKARILVTNSIAFISQFDHLTFIRRGIMLEQGSYLSLLANPNSEISKLVYVLGLYRYVYFNSPFVFSKGHGTGSNNSGSSTPFATTSGSATPKSEGEFRDTGKESEYAATLAEKLRHRSSFQKARKIAEIATHKPTGGLSKEHREQGRVKIEVYKQYIQAASKAGFAFFLFTTIAQQAASVLATLTLRYWGEHNREIGNNSGMFKYLLVYGCFSLSSSLLGAISAITMWVYCALRSARYLHDSVCIFSMMLSVCG